MEENLVSIITPVYNAEKLIEETIKSVLNQTYKNWEMILVNDCSVDKSEQIIKKYSPKDARIKYIKLTTNLGAAKSRNIGIEKARGQYIAFLDSDDLWKPNKLERQIKFMKEKDIAFSFTAYEVIKEDGTLINRVINAPKKLSYYKYLKNTIIGCLTVIIDREKTGNFFMIDIRKNQDMATWLSVLKRGFYAYGLNENLAMYRLVNGSISNNKVKASKSVWRTYRDVEKLDILHSSFYFSCYVFNAFKKRV